MTQFALISSGKGSEQVNPLYVELPRKGQKGDRGLRAWSPVIANVVDGARVVQQVVDWVSGEGVKPAINLYVGPSGYVTAIASATDVRGGSGSGTVDVDARASILALQGGANIPSGKLLEWAQTKAYRFAGVTSVDPKGNPLPQSIVWPDGGAGTYTPSILHSSGYYTRVVLFHQASGKSATGNITRNTFGEIVSEAVWVVTP